MGGSFAVRNGFGEIGEFEILFLPDVHYIAGLERELDSTEKTIHREAMDEVENSPDDRVGAMDICAAVGSLHKNNSSEMFDLLNASAWVDGPLASMTGCHRF
jgi:hypothetical protein